MKLTKNFSLDELTFTNVGVPNIPSDFQLEKLQYLASYILQPIRNKFGKIKINSGFRSLSVNLAIGGAVGSQHLRGEAADIVSLEVSLEELYSWIIGNLIFGQVIFEKRKTRNKYTEWVHISLPRFGMVNNQALITTI